VRCLPAMVASSVKATPCQAETQMGANSLAVVKLGALGDPWRAQSEWSGLRHVVFRAKGAASVQGLWRIVRPGYRVLSDYDLASLGYW
jgi:hypothetical protein